MADGKPYRNYSAICQWPGKDEFYLGTVALNAKAKQHDIEKALHDEFIQKMLIILPDGTPMPEIKQIIPGMIMLITEEE